jgi:hypothetical protein
MMRQSFSNAYFIRFQVARHARPCHTPLHVRKRVCVQATFALSLFSKSCHYEQWSIDGAVAFHEGRLVCVGVVLIVEAVGQHGAKRIYR